MTDTTLQQIIRARNESARELRAALPEKAGPTELARQTWAGLPAAGLPDGPLPGDSDALRALLETGGDDDDA